VAADDPAEVEAHELASWELAAATYAEVSGFATALSGQLDIAVELGEISSSTTVLDIGCGPGQLTALLAQIARSATGVDFSERMIAAARSLFPGVCFEVANGESLPFAEQAFDVVVGCYVANHLARPEVAFREQRRVLGPGGRLVLITPIHDEQASLGVLYRALAECLPQQDEEMFPSGPLARVSDPGVHSELLEAAGFRQVMCERRVKPLVQADLEQMCAALWHLAGLGRLPEDDQRRIRGRIEELAAPFREQDGYYRFPDKVIACVATR